MAPQGTPNQRIVEPLGRHMANQPIKSRQLQWIALSCVALLTMVVAFSGFALLRLRSNVHTAEINIGELSSNLASGPLDILIIGSDTRSGANGAYGSSEDVESGARSDVMMLVQVSEDRSAVNVISFPRDLMVDIPKCTDATTGEVYPATSDTQINESLERGGPGCTVATISNLTGVAIDHFMLVDFNAVKALSSVVGGVEVCVSEPIDDTYSGLKLPAGTSSVEGEQALAFLRSRHGFGDGSDTARIKAQQSFLASLLRKVQSEGTLSNPAMLLKMAEAITQNVTVDTELTKLGNLVGIGSIFSSVDLSKVVFATVPNEPYIYDENKLQLSSEAEAFFTKLQKDQSLVEPSPSPSAVVEEPSTSTTQALNYALDVTFTNASGVTGRASKLASVTKDAGFSAVTAQEGTTVYPASTVYYPYGYDAEAQLIADLYGITTVTPSSLHTGIEVVLGSDLASEDKLQTTQAEIAGGASGQTADQVTCQQAFSY